MKKLIVLAVKYYVGRKSELSALDLWTVQDIDWSYRGLQCLEFLHNLDTK